MITITISINEDEYNNFKIKEVNFQHELNKSNYHEDKVANKLKNTNNVYSILKILGL